MTAVIDWIRSWGPAYFAHGGYYVLPVVGIVLTGAIFVVWNERLAGAVDPRHRRVARTFVVGLLGVAALFSVVAYNNFFGYHYGGYLNAYEFYHYYLGSKYSAEIGYFGLYDATVVADADSGALDRPLDARVRDLRTLEYHDVGSILSERETYRWPFSAERWQEWLDDVAFFRERLGPEAWSRIPKDRGYNATPVWTMVAGGGLSSRVPTSSRAGMTMLALLDAVLLGAAFVMVGHTFGLRTTLLAIIFLGSSYLMAHVHMKGAFLRTDFVVALLFAMCLLRRGHDLAAGALVAYATTSRIFPAVFALGIAVKLVGDLVPVVRSAIGAIRDRTGSRARARVVLAACAAASIALAAAVLRSTWILIGPSLRATVTEHVGAAPRLFAVALLPTAALIVLAACVPRGLMRRELPRHRLKFVAGFVATGGILFSASVLYAGSAAVWSEFATKISRHREVYHFWNVGLPTIFAGERPAAGGSAPLDEDGISPSRAGSPGAGLDYSREALQERRIAVRVAQVVVLLLWLAAIRGLDDSGTLALGFVPVFVLVSPTYYYYIVLLLPFVFVAQRADRWPGFLAVVYAFVFAAAGHALYQRWDQYFTTYFWNSVLGLGFAIILMGVAAGEGRAKTKGPPPLQSATGRRKFEARSLGGT